MLFAEQQSAFSAFSYRILNASRQPMGSLVWPALPLATNSRLKNIIPENLTTSISFDIEGETHEISFEYLNRQWSNDVRFHLMHNQATLASADVVSTEEKSEEKKPLLNRKSILILAPFEGRLLKNSTFFRARYLLEANQNKVGEIAEKSPLTFKRQVTIDLPDSMSVPLQVFFFFLMCNHAYR